MRELVSPGDAVPITLIGGPGTKCGPCLTITKDPDLFAACNALAEEIGPLDEPEKAFRLLEEAIGDEVNEVFGVLMLDLHNRHKGIAVTGRGEPSSVMAPIQPTLQVALMNGAHGAIIFHVHPSGIEAKPSQADIDTTAAFVEAFDTVGLPLLDHVIVGGDARNRSYYSFLEDNAI
jgi:DNA repair protein RadC